MPIYTPEQAFEAAQRQLSQARDPSIKSQAPVGRFRVIVKRHRFSLKSFGTTKSELTKLSKLAHLNLGRYHLQLAREPDNFKVNHALWPRTCVRRAKARLCDIGTTRDELIELTHRASRNPDLRDQASDRLRQLKKFQRHQSWNMVSPEVRNTVDTFVAVHSYSLSNQALRDYISKATELIASIEKTFETMH